VTHTVTTQIELDAEKEQSLLTGEFQKNLKLIEEALGIIISSRGNKVMIQGEGASVEKARTLINELRSIRRSGYSVMPEDVRYAAQSLSCGEAVSLRELFDNNVEVSPKKKLVIPKTETQREYIEAIKRNDMVIGIGPAGTGKTYLAMAMAVNALLRKQVSRLVLARPAVEAGERLGFLPGDMYAKVNPYLRPLYDALFDMMEAEQANRLIERGIIEIAPLAYMRGRTLNDSFIILDEAQNTTAEQMKMYLTRLGFNSKTVITGDITQIDLPSGKASGLVEARTVLGGIEGIKIVYFSEKDVIRHRLVQEIVRAYDKYERRQKEYKDSPEGPA
jgi:phosphate starvation-inducible PhoH-like protein